MRGGDAVTEARDVRRLRFALAEALAQAGTSRTAEALAELDRALTESGNAPSSARINFAAGQLLEITDPGSALERYVEGMDGEPQAIVRARALLLRPDLTASLPSLPSTVVDQAEAEARRNPSSDACLLAAGLLQHRGENERALDILRLAKDRGDAPQDEVLAQTAEILVDLDRIDEAWQLIEGRGLDVEARSLQLVQAKVHLLRGEFDNVLNDLERLEHGVADEPDLAVIKALSLLAQGRADDALDTLQPFDLPEALRARTAVYLARRDYRQAGQASWDLLRARAANVDALLLRAQIALEAVGSGEAEVGPADQGEPGAPFHRSDELDSARLLLGEVVKEADSLDLRSWWWRAQDVVRGSDGRYQFFRSELRLARGMTVTVDELDAVDLGTTTYLQDAALATRKAELFVVDEPARAAEAYTEAGDLFRDWIKDVERSFQCASRAYQLDPTLPHAINYAYGAINASYVDGVDITVAAERLQHGIAAVEPLVVGAALDDLRGLVRPIAVLNTRLTELSPEKVIDRSLRAAWLCVASLTLDSDDVYVSSALADRLTALDMYGAAMAFAHIAYDADSTDPYYLEALIAAVVNFSGTIEEAAPYLKRHAELSEAIEWRNSVELDCQLVAGNREAVSKGIERPLVSAAWAVNNAALGLALIQGIPETTTELSQALDTSAAGSPPDREATVGLACLLGRHEEAREQLAAAAASGNHTSWELDLMREKIEFAFDQGISNEDFLGRALALCVSPRSVRRLLNVHLPLLVAARERQKGPVPAVSADQRIVDARLQELERRREHWQTDVDQRDSLLSGLTRLWSALRVAGNISAVFDITRSLPRLDIDEMLSMVVEGISQAAVDRALADLPVQLVRSIADGTNTVDLKDLRLVLDGVVDQPLPRRLALALLDDHIGHGNLEPLTAALGDGQAEETVNEVVAAARSAKIDVEAWWRLDDRLATIQSTIEAVQDMIAGIRTSLLDMLCDLLGMNTPVSEDRSSYFSFIAGSDFIPDDTGPDWELFRDLIPAMRERIRRDTGFVMPGCTVRGDWRNPDSLWLTVYLGLMEAHRLPTHGFIQPAASAESHDLRDPLTGDPVVVERDDRPADSWTPLEFLMRHVERFARDHLAELVGPWHVRESAERVGEDVLELVTSSPAVFTNWLQLLRKAARAGTLQDADAAAHRIAEAVLGSEYSVHVRQPG
jgi:hypothetical protein